MPHHAIARPVDGAFAVLHVFQKDGGKLALLTLKDEVGGQVAEPLRDGQRGLDESLVKPDVGMLVRQDRNALDVGKAIEHENSVIEGGSRVVASLYDLVLGQGQSPQVSAGIDFTRLAGKSAAVDQQKLQFAPRLVEARLHQGRPYSLVHLVKQIELENTILEAGSAGDPPIGEKLLLDGISLWENPRAGTANPGGGKMIDVNHASPVVLAETISGSKIPAGNHAAETGRMVTGLTRLDGASAKGARTGSAAGGLHPLLDVGLIGRDEATD